MVSIASGTGTHNYTFLETDRAINVDVNGGNNFRHVFSMMHNQRSVDYNVGPGDRELFAYNTSG